MKLLYAVRNVAAHADEMGQQAPPEPVFFLKPETSRVDGSALSLPLDIGRIEFEAELALEVGKPLHRASVQAAAAAIDRVGVTLDLTARELQAQRKQSGLPWLEAKGFPGSCVVGPLVEHPGLEALSKAEVSLQVNGQPRQRFAVGSYTVGPAELLARCSRWLPLEAGDIVGCGTGSGVGPLFQGDAIRTELVGLDGTLWEGEVVEGPERT